MRHEKAECISGSDSLASLAGPSWQVSRLWESAKMGGSTTCSLARLYIIAGSGSGFSWQLAGAATTLVPTVNVVIFLTQTVYLTLSR